MKKIKRQLVCNQFAMCRIIESLIFTPEKRIVCQLYFKKKKKKMKPQKFVVDLTSCISLLKVLYNTRLRDVNNRNLFSQSSRG